MARKAAPKAKPKVKKVTALRNKMTKAAMLTHIAQETGLTRVRWRRSCPNSKS